MSSFIRDVFDLLLKDTKIMATLLEITAKVDAVKTKIGQIDLKLDDVRALVSALKAGAVSQAEIDALAAKVDELGAATSAVVTEVDSIE
jgi:hypothetical protein